MSAAKLTKEEHESISAAIAAADAAEAQARAQANPHVSQLPHGFEFSHPPHHTCSVNTGSATYPAFPPSLTCHHCTKSSVVKVDKKLGPTSAAASFGAFAICGPLFWVPLLFDGIKDDVYYCGTCNVEIGRVPGYKKI
ncbi:hypothetical protein GQ42DRAFT_172584 [Ramicandelaber brevisporus]|nr:hypothetical protein GQ42DRAFT_172584 [Ramicandelaber brevisporus]